MKKTLFLGVALCSLVVMTGCKSKDSAYREAYERAMSQETTTTEPTTPVVVTPAPEEKVNVTPVTPVQNQNSNAGANDRDVRTIDGDISLVAGEPLKTYSVVVGSFVGNTNAEGLCNTLRNKGYNARVVKTSETIKGQTGWYRVIASSYDDKGSAVSSRDQLKAAYQGAWLLYRK